MARTGPTNPMLVSLIDNLKQKSLDQNTKIWTRVADDLSKPTRNRRIVNLSKINKYTKEDDTIVVPGKVLGSGDLDHKLTIAAFQFSESALNKLNKAGAKVISLGDLSNESPKGKRIRILG